MDEEKWRKNMKSVFDRVNVAIENFSNAIVYYPTWEEVFIMRAEAYRSRVSCHYKLPRRFSH